MPIQALILVVLTACQTSSKDAPLSLRTGSYQIRAVPDAKPVTARAGGLPEGLSSGTLEVRQLGGQAPEDPLRLPLEHTDVAIQVSGFAARAVVTQKYGNPYDEPIEAVYTFPLPDEAAVDAMTMKIGERIIRGEIRKRDEARKAYEAARDRGERASLLEQERPNVFTQAVANIMPGDEIEILIEYVDILDYADGAYELVFPMVVGPRYIPGKPTGKEGSGTAPDTDRVPDASKITPPVLTPEQRSGHDIALAVELEAGIPIRGLHSTSHALDVWDRSESARTIKLSGGDTIPNKDFILRYQVAGDAPQLALLPHRDERGGFFTLMVQPQREVSDRQTSNRELIFIVDTSGSMGGEPMETAKAAVTKLITGMRPGDRFNVVRFASETGTLYEEPRIFNEETAKEAIEFVDGLTGRGGTEMAKGITEALRQPAAPQYLRLAFLLTDGYVDESEVFDSIQNERRSTRVFALGVGSSPNRYLLDRAAILGRGEAFFVRQGEDPTKVTNELLARVDRPALTGIEIDWGGLDVTDVYPARIPDLFAGTPLRVHGRYQKGGSGTVTIRAELAGAPYEQTIEVSLSDDDEHDTMASVWARQKVKSLMLEMSRGEDRQKAIDEITAVGLEFALMTQWTSFVALEERVVNVDGKPKTVVQPVELPEGVSYEGVFGEADPMEAGGRMRFKRIGGGGMAGLLGSAGGMSRGLSYRGGVLTSTPVVTGALPKEVIHRVINRNKAKIRYCYEKQLKKNPGLAGKVTVKLIIAATGRVAKVIITSSTLNNKQVEDCLKAAIKRWRFPAPAGGGIVEVNYPFVFKPAK